VHSPHHSLRRVQRRINKRILSDQNLVAWPDHLFGSLANQQDEEGVIHGKDYISCATVHCGAKSVLTMDIKDFFENIHQTRVAEIFREFFKYSEEVANTLAHLCCLEGRVVQGALTSSYIACLCLFDVEGKVVSRLSTKNLRYTRLVDDITVSSHISDFSFELAKRLIEEMLASNDLPVNNAKTRIQHVSTLPLTVHGLRVAFNEPRLQSDEIRRIRAAVKSVETLSKEGAYRMSRSYRRDFNRCMGRVNKLARVGHSQHAPLARRLSNILPLPSKKDLELDKKIVERLETDFVKKRNTYWYKRRFYLAHERINIINRSFRVAAAELRARLKKVPQTYE
jgi:RNA-directed DNA polymerase